MTRILLPLSIMGNIYLTYRSIDLYQKLNACRGTPSQSNLNVLVDFHKKKLENLIYNINNK